MTYPEDVIDEDATCPHLGLADDADSHATYATEAHRCYKLPNPTRIATGHQESYCLGANHPSCPVYQGEGVPQSRPAAAAAVAPAEGGPPVPPPGAPARGQRRPQQPRRQPPGSLGPRPRAGGISMPVATVGLFALAIALVALAFLIQRALSGDDDGGLTPAESFQTQQALNETQTEQAGGGGGDETPATGETPGTDESPTIDPGEEETPTPDNGDGNGGGGGDTYVVQSGDTCSGIANEFGTTVDAIIAANDLDEACNLAVDQELIIP